MHRAQLRAQPRVVDEDDQDGGSLEEADEASGSATCARPPRCGGRSAAGSRRRPSQAACRDPRRAAPRCSPCSTVPEGSSTSPPSSASSRGSASRRRAQPLLGRGRAARPGFRSGKGRTRARREGAAPPRRGGAGARPDDRGVRPRRAPEAEVRHRRRARGHADAAEERDRLEEEPVEDRVDPERREEPEDGPDASDEDRVAPPDGPQARGQARRAHERDPLRPREPDAHERHGGDTASARHGSVARKTSLPGGRHVDAAGLAKSARAPATIAIPSSHARARGSPEIPPAPPGRCRAAPSTAAGPRAAARGEAGPEQAAFVGRRECARTLARRGRGAAVGGFIGTAEYPRVSSIPRVKPYAARRADTEGGTEGARSRRSRARARRAGRARGPVCRRRARTRGRPRHDERDEGEDDHVTRRAHEKEREAEPCRAPLRTLPHEEDERLEEDRDPSRGQVDEVRELFEAVRNEREEDARDPRGAGRPRQSPREPESPVARERESDERRDPVSNCEGARAEREEREHREARAEVALAERERLRRYGKKMLPSKRCSGSWNVWWKSHQSTQDVK